MPCDPFRAGVRCRDGRLRARSRAGHFARCEIMGHSSTREQRKDRAERITSEEYPASLSAEERHAKALENLTEKQRHFVREYKRHMNATRAARAAFEGDPDLANRVAWDTMQNAHVKACITAWREMMEKRYEISEQIVMQELTKIALGNMSDLIKIGADGKPELDLSDAGRD